MPPHAHAPHRSLLTASAARRLLWAGALLAVLWAVVGWAMAS